MDRNITTMNNGSQDHEKPLPFKDSFILNLERNKQILLQNINVANQNILVFKRKMELCDELITLIAESDDATKFAEKMSALQTDVTKATTEQQ